MIYDKGLIIYNTVLVGVCTFSKKITKGWMTPAST